MRLQTELQEEESVRVRFIKRYFTKKMKIGFVLLIAAGIAIIVGNVVSYKGKTTKIGFEDIGELATQTAYLTELNVIENSRNLFGVTIPFTQSKYIYSYDVVVKAGFNFEDIQWDKNGKSIEVKLPKVKVLSSDINLNSFKIYHEQESIFNQIDMTESNDAMKDLKEKAEKDAIANGLLENARSNVETILTGFFGKAYDLSENEVIFKDK